MLKNDLKKDNFKTSSKLRKEVRLTHSSVEASVFQNLLTHLNVESLTEAFNALDGVSKKAYRKNLQTNLENLVDRIKRGVYRPMPKREVLIPKSNGKERPIAIACFEDKLVDWVISRILTEIYEPCFIT